MKDSFIVRKKYWNQIQKLTANQRVELMECVFSYQLEWKYDSEDWVVCMLLDIMIDEWEKDDEKYLEMCEKNREIALEREKKKKLRKEKSHEQHERVQPCTNVTNSTDNDSDSDIKENSISKDILKEKETLYSSYYWKKKWIDEKVCNKLIDDKLKQWITLDDIWKWMVLYNCECRLKQNFTYVMKFETWIRWFHPLNEQEIDESLYVIVKAYRDKKKSDDKFWQSSVSKTIWNDLKSTFWDEKVKWLLKQANSIQLNFT